MAKVTKRASARKGRVPAGSRTRSNGRASRGRTVVAHPTPAERAAHGKRARADVPRSAHAEIAPVAGRRDPVAVLEDQAPSRVAELVPLRYGRMLVTPFTFYRGAAAIMAADLAQTPRTELHVQLCGDAHLANFGAFAAPDRRLVFSVNDFDETLPGPFEWDVKRLAASFAVAGRDRGFNAKQRREVNLAVTRAYREAMRDFAGMRTLDVWNARLDVDAIYDQFRKQATGKQVRRFEANRAKAQSKDSLRALSKLTRMVDGKPRIVSDPPAHRPGRGAGAGRPARLDRGLGPRRSWPPTGGRSRRTAAR